VRTNHICLDPKLYLYNFVIASMKSRQASKHAQTRKAPGAMRRTHSPLARSLTLHDTRSTQAHSRSRNRRYQRYQRDTNAVTVCRCSAADAHGNIAQPAQSPCPRILPTLPPAPLPQVSTAGIDLRRARAAEPPPRRYAATTITTAIDRRYRPSAAMPNRAAATRRTTPAASRRLSRESGSRQREPPPDSDPRRCPADSAPSRSAYRAAAIDRTAGLSRRRLRSPPTALVPAFPAAASFVVLVERSIRWA
jgi:hypothetical protein